MSEMLDETPTFPRVLTCHTAGCGNAGHDIAVEMPENASAVCGACGEPIEDVREA